MAIQNVVDGGQLIKDDSTKTKIKKSRTIIDTIFKFDTPKYTYKEKYAPVHAGNSLQRINEYKNNCSLHVNRKCKNNVEGVVAVAVPRKFKRDY